MSVATWFARCASQGALQNGLDHVRRVRFCDTEIAGIAQDILDNRWQVRLVDAQLRQPCGRTDRVKPLFQRCDPLLRRGLPEVNRGTPGCVITSSGDLCMSLMRSCTGWPSGIWVDPPRRTTPDGSGFQLQRWSHTFEYAVVAGSALG